MLVIRRLDDGKRSYTAMMLPGEPARIFPTTDHEHARILAIYKQDRPHPGVINDFTRFGLAPVPAPVAPPPRPRPKRGKKPANAAGRD